MKDAGKISITEIRQPILIKTWSHSFSYTRKLVNNDNKLKHSLYWKNSCHYSKLQVLQMHNMLKKQIERLSNSKSFSLGFWCYFTVMSFYLQLLLSLSSCCYY